MHFISCIKLFIFIFYFLLENFTLQSVHVVFCRKWLRCRPSYRVEPRDLIQHTTWTRQYRPTEMSASMTSSLPACCSVSVTDFSLGLWTFCRPVLMVQDSLVSHWYVMSGRSASDLGQCTTGALFPLHKANLCCLRSFQ